MSYMDDISKALQHINRSVSSWNQLEPIPFDEFLKVLTANPTEVIRNVFQVFHDMVMSHIGARADEYPADPESIHYVSYNCNRLFVEDTDHPFFADRLFANRLVNLVASWKRGAQQNKIYIFEGPPGSGKSTFLNVIGALDVLAVVIAVELLRKSAAYSGFVTTANKRNECPPEVCSITTSAARGCRR